MTATTDTITSRALRGVVWLGLLSGGKHFLLLIRLMVLSRLLTPATFGIFGLAITIIRGFEMATEFGPEKYVIQTKSVSEDLIGTAWSMRVVANAIVGLMAFLLAPLLGTAIGNPEVTGVLQIVCIASAVRGLKSPGTYLAERDLNFGKLSVYEFSISALEVIVVISLAQWFRGPMALAWSLVCVSLIDVSGSYIFFRSKFKPRFDLSSVRQLWNAGKHLVIISIGSFLMIQGDNYLVGTMMSPTALGYYLVAYRLCELPFQAVLQLTGRVFFNVFSRIQDDVTRRRRTFINIFDLQITALIPLMVALMTLADSLLKVVSGPGWEPAVPCLRALGAVILGRGISNFIAPFLVANGHYQFASRVKIVETVVFLIGVVIGIHYFGIVGAALGAGIGYLVAGVTRLYYLVYLEQLPKGDLIRPFLGALALVTPGALGALWIDTLTDYSPLIRLVMGAIVLIGGYLGLTWVFRRSVYEKIWRLKKHI
jgi:O-antigen/teichoic acid export membrane protein